jgi:hypothetical protein
LRFAGFESFEQRTKWSAVFCRPRAPQKDQQHAEFPGHWLASLQLPANTLHYLSQGAGHGGGTFAKPPLAHGVAPLAISMGA